MARRSEPAVHEDPELAERRRQGLELQARIPGLHVDPSGRRGATKPATGYDPFAFDDNLLLIDALITGIARFLGRLVRRRS